MTLAGPPLSFVLMGAVNRQRDDAAAAAADTCERAGHHVYGRISRLVLVR
jgi:hypothetical protein